MLEDALAAAAQERDEVATAFDDDDDERDAVTYSMLVVVGRASHAFHTWRCVARRRSDAQVPRYPLYTTRPRAIRTASPSL